MLRILLAWALLACALQSHAASIPRGEDDGYVVARVVINGEGRKFRDFVFFQQGYYPQVLLQPVDRPKYNYFVQVTPTTMQDAHAISVHASRLPPGKYKLMGFANVVGNAQTIWAAEGAFPEIELLPRHVLDLGTFVLQPTGPERGIALQWTGSDAFDPVDHGTNVDMTLLPKETIVDRWQPDAEWKYTEGRLFMDGTLLLHLTFGKSNTTDYWNGWPQSATLEETRAKVRRSTAWLGLPSETEEAAWFGSSLGQVLRRSRDGSWTSFDTGLASPINSVLAEPGHLYAAARSGELLESVDEGKTWKSSGKRIPGGAAQVVRLPSGEFLLLSQGLRQSDLALYRGRDFLGLVNATPVALPAYRRETAETIPVTLNVMKDRAIIGMPPKTIASYDLATGAVTSIKAKALGELASLPGGEVVYSRNAAGGGDGMISGDGGATWEKYDSGSVYVLGYGFRDRLNGLGLQLTKTTMSGGKFQLATTSDGGKHWQTTRIEPPVCSDLHYLPKAALYYCADGDGSVQTTSDGLHWNPERKMD